MKQGTREWFLARVGHITGSDMPVIMEGGVRAWATLLDRKRAEIENPELAITEDIVSPPILWGKENESRAIAHYELIYDIEVERPCFIKHPDIPYVGCSPDFLDREFVGEVKCPYREEIHAMTVVHGTGAESYKPQIQGEIWITKSQAARFLSYDPRYKDPHKQLIVITVERDEEYIKQMAQKCEAFWRHLENGTYPEEIGSLNQIPSIF